MNFNKTNFKYAIIEDAPDVCIGLEERMAEHHKWHLCGVADEIEAAIALIEKEKPYLIFMDWNIKGGSTYELLSFIKSNEQYHPYIVFFTGFQNEEPGIPVRVHNEYKVDKYLLKPFWLDFTENLNKYLDEATAKNNIKSDFTFLKDINGTAHRIKYADLVHINRHHENSRVKVLTFIDGQSIDIKCSFDEMETILRASEVDYFFTNKRYSIVCRNFIKSYDPQFVYFENGIFKTDIVSDRYRLFEEWLLNK